MSLKDSQPESLKDKINRILNASIKKLEDRINSQEEGREIYSKDLIQAIKILYTIAEAETAKELGAGDPALPMRYSKNQGAWIKPPELPQIFPLSTKMEEKVDNPEPSAVQWETP